MDAEDSKPKRDDESSEDDSLGASPFRQLPSRNQKRRSRLQQAVEPPPEVDPEPEPAPAAKPPPPIVRKFRMKRSGQMHDDLKSPLPDDNTPLREPEY